MNTYVNFCFDYIIIPTIVTCISIFVLLCLKALIGTILRSIYEEFIKRK